MAEEIKNQNASAREWMEFYEELFKEKHPVKRAPLPIENTEEEQGNQESN